MATRSLFATAYGMLEKCGTVIAISRVRPTRTLDVFARLPHRAVGLRLQ
jgi:hypothetical protein